MEFLRPIVEDLQNARAPGLDIDFLRRDSPRHLLLCPRARR
jgi:hypothetical protein